MPSSRNGSFPKFPPPPSHQPARQFDQTVGKFDTRPRMSSVRKSGALGRFTREGNQKPPALASLRNGRMPVCSFFRLTGKTIAWNLLPMQRQARVWFGASRFLHHQKNQKRNGVRPMKKKLAITISGAVSLGSYEAGVLYEVIRAIGLHNQSPNTKPEDKIYIDVLTGASAGGMTATIAAQKLLYEAQSLSGAYTNAFYSPWVAEISIQRLLNLHGADSDQKSIFSSEAVVEISEKYITGRYQSHLNPAPDPHPALDADNLKLGLAMSNLNGVDYSAPLHPAGQLTYTRFKDELIREFDVPNSAADDNDDVWDALRNAAVSCGAFPFAFKVVEVARQLGEYNLPDRASSIGNSAHFTYTDGGTFQNEPLSLAKRLVDSIDGHQDLENRFFLFVAPDLKKSSANADFNDRNATFISTATHLVGAIFGQARFPDLLLAEELNQEVMLLNSRAAGLKTMLNGKDQATFDKAKTLRAAADLLLPALFEGEPASPLADARARLQNQFATDYSKMAPQTRDTWIDSILTLERAAGLDETDEMTIYSITASDAELE